MDPTAARRVVTGYCSHQTPKMLQLRNAEEICSANIGLCHTPKPIMGGGSVPFH